MYYVDIKIILKYLRIKNLNSLKLIMKKEVISNDPFREMFTDHANFMIHYNNRGTWQMKSCIYDGTERSRECNYDSYQLFKDFSGVYYGIGMLPYKFAPYALTNRNDKGVLQTCTLGSVCWYHAQKDPQAAFLEIAKKHDVSLSECVVWRFVKDKVMTFEELNLTKAFRKELFDPVVYEKENAGANSIVQFGNGVVNEATKGSNADIDEPKISMFLKHGDRRCIFTMEYCKDYKCNNHDCNNLEHNYGQESKEMSLPAYIVYHKNYSSDGPIGNICYKHAVTLQSSLKQIADKATRDSGKEVTLDDLKIDIHWDSDGHMPSKYSEEDFRLQYMLNPEWKSDHPLCKKWKRIEGNPGKCRLCSHKYIVPYNMNYKGILPDEVLESPEYFAVGLFCCRKCQTEVQNKGCGKCGCKLTKENTFSDTVNFNANEKMFCKDCFNCQSCGKIMKPYGHGLPQDSKEYKSMSYDELVAGSRDGYEKVGNTGPCGADYYSTYRKCRECYRPVKRRF